MKSIIRKLITAGVAASALIILPVTSLAKKIEDMSAAEKMKASGNGDLVGTLFGIALIFGIIIFTALFFRRWRIPRLGYFFITVVIIISRFRLPHDLFWIMGAIAAGLLSLVMALSAYKRTDFDTKKEPLYYLFNGFTLLIIAFSTELFTMALACASLFASLFFMITIRKGASSKFTQLDADGKILEVLANKAQRK